MKINAFTGRAKTSIDDKGRTSFPREFRRCLSDDDGREVVVTIGPGRLILFTIPEWEKYVERLSHRPRTKENLQFIAMIHNSANVSELDGQNRISLTRDQMEHAGLKGEVVFAARGGKTLDLWNPERFDQNFGLKSEAEINAFEAAFYDDTLEGPAQ